MNEEWRHTTLGDATAITIGRTPARKEPRYWTDDLSHPFCTIADMTDSKVNPVREGVTMEAIAEGKAKLVPAGSLLMSFKLTIGRVGFAERDLYPNEAIAWIRSTDPDLDERFLAIWLSSQDLAAGSGRAVKGDTLNGESLRAIDVIVPPLSVQRRIVDLMAHLDDHLANLRAERHRAKRLLTASSEILMEGHPTRRVAEIAHPAKGLVGGPFGSSLVSTDYVADGVPVVRGANMPSSGMFLKGPFVFVSNEKAESLSRNLASPGDVIFTQRGTLGQVGIVPDWLVTAVVSQSQMRLRVDPSLAIPAFVFHAFARPSMVRDIQSRNTATANPHINLGILAEIDLPLPPLEVQAEIVESLGAIGQAHEALASEILETEALRRHLLSDLMSQRITVDSAYDSFLTRAA